MPIEHKKEFRIYHWDTFDNTIFLNDEADTLNEAIEKVEKKFGSRLRADGADQIDIVNSKGALVKVYKLG
jgi:hypothetical protein